MHVVAARKLSDSILLLNVLSLNTKDLNLFVVCHHALSLFFLALGASLSVSS